MTLPCVVAGAWYARVIPKAMMTNLSVALLTQALQAWSQSALWVLAGAGIMLAAAALLGMLRPSIVRSWLLAVPAVLSVLLIGTYERVREFIRKPYAIADYLYSNGVRKADYPLLQRDGLLTHATYTSVRQVTAENQVAAGREVFVLACTRCHTVDGVNGMRSVLSTMYGDKTRWDREAIASYIGAMHNARPFMPPFPGSDRERSALAAYLAQLQFHRDSIEGAQNTGAIALPRPTPQQ